MPPLKEPHSPAAQPLKPCAPPQQPSASPSLNPSAPPTCILVYGVDFTSRPTSRKPLTVAHGQLLLPQRVLQVQTLSRLATHQQLSDLLFGPGLGTEGGDEVPKEGESETQAAPAPATGRLPAQSLNMRCKEGTSASTASLSPPAKSPTATTGSTAQRAAPNASTTTCTSTDSTSASISPRQHVRVAALDFPFGQPRGLVDALGWGPGWRDLVRHTTQRRSQQEFEAALKAFMARQPPGAKHLKRAVAAHSREVSPMSLVRTPTAKMFWVGAGLLAAAADAGRALLPHHLPPPLQPSSSLPFRQAPPCSCATAEAHQYGQCRTGRTGQEELQEGGRHEGDPEATCPSLGDSPGERVCGHVPVPLPVCVCVEAYPALPARRVLSRPGAGGRAVSYKSDAAAGAADGARREARRAVLRALMHAAEPAGHAAAVAAADEASPATLEGLAGALEREAVGSLQQTRARGLPPGGEAQCVDGCGGSEAPGEVHGGGGSTAVSLAAEFGLQRVELEAGVARQCEEDPSGEATADGGGGRGVSSLLDCMSCLRPTTSAPRHSSCLLMPHLARRTTLAFCTPRCVPHAVAPDPVIRSYSTSPSTHEPCYPATTHSAPLRTRGLP